MYKFIDDMISEEIEFVRNNLTPGQFKQWVSRDILRSLLYSTVDFRYYSRRVSALRNAVRRG